MKSRFIYLIFLLTFLVFIVCNCERRNSSSTESNVSSRSSNIPGNNNSIYLNIIFDSAIEIASDQNNLRQYLDTLMEEINTISDSLNIKFDFKLNNLDIKEVRADDFKKGNNSTENVINVYIKRSPSKILDPETSITTRNIIIPDHLYKNPTVWIHEFYHSITHEGAHTQELNRDTGEYVACKIPNHCLNLLRANYIGPFSFLMTREQVNIFNNRGRSEICDENSLTENYYPRSFCTDAYIQSFTCCSNIDKIKELDFSEIYSVDERDKILVLLNSMKEGGICIDDVNNTTYNGVLDDIISSSWPSGTNAVNIEEQKNQIRLILQQHYAKLYIMETEYLFKNSSNNIKASFFMKRILEANKLLPKKLREESLIRQEKTIKAYLNELGFNNLINDKGNIKKGLFNATSLDKNSYLRKTLTEINNLDKEYKLQIKNFNKKIKSNK
jgi:hypothetical protein